jgi:hypothetical protein
MPERYRHRGQGHAHFGHARVRKVMGEKYRKPAFETVADQRQNSGGFFAGAQHIGCPRIAGTVAARIWQGKRPAHENGKRN